MQVRLRRFDSLTYCFSEIYAIGGSMVAIIHLTLQSCTQVATRDHYIHSLLLSAVETA